VQPSPHTNWVLALRGVKTRVRRVLQSLCLPPTTTEEIIKSTKTHYPSNPKPSFYPKREVRKETPKPREEVFICMFCGRASHLDGFCLCRKRIEKKRFDYARNSYRNEFIDFLPCSYSHAPPRFFHGPNYRTYGFGS
jgi:hypothetical protein